MDSELVGLAKGKQEVIVLAIIATVGAGIWSFFVVFANGMSASPGEFKGAGTIWVAWIIAAVLWLAWGVDKASAHDHSRPELDVWFKSLQSKKAGSCCDGSDSMRVDDPDWDNENGHYRVRLEGEWVDVPENAVILEPNRVGHALVWPYRQNGKLNQIRCFMPGSLT